VSKVFLGDFGMQLVAFFLCCFIGPLPPPLPSTKTNQYIVVPSDEVEDCNIYNVLQ
jgi:hypothetical protein